MAQLSLAIGAKLEDNYAKTFVQNNIIPPGIDILADDVVEQIQQNIIAAKNIGVSNANAT